MAESIDWGVDDEDDCQPDDGPSIFERFRRYLVIESALDVAARYGEFYPPYMGLMVGDRPEDQECARLAGLDFQWAADWRAQAKAGVER